MKKNKKNPQDNIDLEDSKQDKKKLRGDDGTLDLPDVGDIPGQKSNQRSLAAGSSDTTASSADEEGFDGLDENDDIITDKKSNVDSMERKLLDEAFDPLSTDDEPIDQLALDTKDNDGDVLNEKGFEKHLFGNDLDTELEEEEDEE